MSSLFWREIDNITFPIPLLPPHRQIYPYIIAFVISLFFLIILIHLPLFLDHHCPWTGKCIAKKNLRSFYIFLNFLSLHIAFVVVTSIVAFATGKSIFRMWVWWWWLQSNVGEGCDNKRCDMWYVHWTVTYIWGVVWMIRGMLTTWLSNVNSIDFFRSCHFLIRMWYSTDIENPEWWFFSCILFVLICYFGLINIVFRIIKIESG